MKIALIIGLIIGFLLMGSGPKKDKRFKSGYKNNEVPNGTAVLVGLLLALGCGLSLWYF